MTGQVRVVTKGLLGGSVYAAPQPLDPDAPNVLEPVGDAPGLITDGAYLDDGRYVLRDYGAAHVFTEEGEEVGAFELPDQEQGESLAVTADGQSVLVGSEGVDSPVWRVPVPADLVAATPAAAKPAPSPAAPVPSDPSPPAASPPAASPPAASPPAAPDGGGRPWALGAAAAGLVALALAGVRLVRNPRGNR